MKLDGAWVVVAGMFCAVALADGPAGVVYDVPRIEKVSIDGQLDDWGDRGFAVKVLRPWQGPLRELGDLDGQLDLAWDDAGLLVAIRGRDDVAEEAYAPADLWQNDCIEAFIAEEPNGAMRVQVLIGPGAGGKHVELRTYVNDQRPKDRRKAAARIEAARTIVEGGYVIEARFPWDMLGVNAEQGRQIAFQMYINDTDADGGGRDKLVWYPYGETNANWLKMYRLRLADQPSEAVVAYAKGDYEQLRRVKVDVAGLGETAGQTVELRDGQTKLASAVMQANGERASAILRAPLSGDKGFERLAVQVGDRAPMEVELPALDKQRAQAVMDAELRFEPAHVFSGESLPTCRFTEPVFMEGAIGLYDINVQYYNAAHQPVTRPEQPGRYGAVVTVTAEDGRTFTRYRTLFRLPMGWEFWNDELTGELALPEEFGIGETVQQRYRRDINANFKWSMVVNAEHYHWTALLLAGLYEAQQDKQAGDASVYDSPWARDRQWWVDQKRVMNGNDQRFTEKLVCPRPTEGKEATVLREGTMAEAGMADDADQRIDAVLTEWAADSDEPFIACVVRHGVVVLHKAYGVRDGKPMTTETSSSMASLSKIVSGTCVMMAVDAGMIDLDKPIDAYSPVFKDAKFNVMPTMRHLYSHTAGMESHRGEDDHELEHLCAEFAPFTQVGQRYEYNGISLELGLKLLEQVSGECYPMYVKRHLLDPLGCADTEAQNATWNTKSTAMDMAKIGQMLLNGGAYGGHRFFSEQTRGAMLPRKLTQLGDNADDTQYGVGTQWFAEPGLSDRCFGHGAASAATLRIDLENDLVISMTRNGAGTNFGKYHPKFITTVTACMVEPAKGEHQGPYPLSIPEGVETHE